MGKLIHDMKHAPPTGVGLGCVTAYQAGPKRLFLHDRLDGVGSDR